MGEETALLGDLFDVVIIGGGPAGLSAAIYTSRMGMKTLILETLMVGGRAVYATLIENFPGFPDGINGIELTKRMVEQAKKFGTEIRSPEEVIDLALDDRVKTTITRSGRYESIGIIIATGTQSKKLMVEGETELLGLGVSYCAVCDGPLFKNREVAVVGSGQEAFEDAIYLSNFSKKVKVITHEDEIEAERSLVDKFKEKENGEILAAKIKSINGREFVKSVTVLDPDKNAEIELPIDGVFIAVGGVPMTSLVRKAGIIVDERGCIEVDRKQNTNVDGVFAAGDCTCGGMQIVTAVGEGARAAMQMYKYAKRNKR
ncbi:MAG: NAD(P)/FAD-dependent oxidoreductase [Candidatus Hodarchaeota archaeon]